VRFGFEGRGCFPTGKHYPGIAHLLKVAAAGLADEFDAQADPAGLPLVSIDTETTGTDPKMDRIVEIALVTMLGGQITGKRSWLVNPQIEIPKEAFDVHGISNQAVADQPTFDQLAGEILEALTGLLPVAYNAEFDQAFLLEELGRAGAAHGKLPPAARSKVRWIDPLIWARELHQDAKSKALGAIAGLLGIELENAHRATDDAVAAALVMAKFFEDARVPRTYGAFLQEQHRLARLQGEQRQYWRNS
jgi:DNA polymerase-3 subunit epsilon